MVFSFARKHFSSRSAFDLVCCSVCRELLSNGTPLDLFWQFCAGIDLCKGRSINFILFSVASCIYASGIWPAFVSSGTHAHEFVQTEFFWCGRHVRPHPMYVSWVVLSCNFWLCLIIIRLLIVVLRAMDLQTWNENGTLTSYSSLTPLINIERYWVSFFQRLSQLRWCKTAIDMNVMLDWHVSCSTSTD